MTLQSDGTIHPQDDALGRAIAERAPWFHNLHLPGGYQTAPDHPLGDFPSFKWDEVASALPEDLTGKSVLDIGCNAGFYTFALAARGARVLGVDLDRHYLEQAAWAREQFGYDESQVRFRQMQVYDLVDLDETFDVVLFMGVLYHLRYPLLALDLVASKVEGILVFQSLTMPGDQEVDPPEDLGIDERDAMLEPGWPLMAFIEKRLAADETNWWAPNHACMQAMLRSAGLEVVERPGHEIYVARRTGDAPLVPHEMRSVFASRLKER